jgi:hypothetical protein
MAFRPTCHVGENVGEAGLVPCRPTRILPAMFYAAAVLIAIVLALMLDLLLYLSGGDE